MALLVMAPRATHAADPVMVTLQPQNHSGESGTATLTEDAGKTKVVVTVTGQPAGPPQPMHIHKGTKL
jgi:Cu/Zn superoxide dismutase